MCNVTSVLQYKNTEKLAKDNGYWALPREMDILISQRTKDYSTFSMKWEPILTQTASNFDQIPILSNPHFTAKK